MAEILQPDDLAAWLRRLESRVAALESAGRPSFVPMDATLWADVNGTFSADWTPIYDLRPDVTVGPAISVRLDAYTDPLTMGEWRVQVTNVTGQPTSNVVAVASTPANALAVITSDAIGYGVANVRIQIQARVTAGGGGIYLAWPTQAFNGISIATSG